jgi:hypothetical protein
MNYTRRVENSLNSFHTLSTCNQSPGNPNASNAEFSSLLFSLVWRERRWRPPPAALLYFSHSLPLPLHVCTEKAPLELVLPATRFCVPGFAVIGASGAMKSFAEGSEWCWGLLLALIVLWHRIGIQAAMNLCFYIRSIAGVVVEVEA